MEDAYNRGFERDFHVWTRPKVARIERSRNLNALVLATPLSCSKTRVEPSATNDIPSQINGAFSVSFYLP